jgi:hypothetical protein
VLSPAVSKNLGRAIAVVLVLSPFVAAFVVVGFVKATPGNAGFSDANAALAFIAGASVGIERAIEGLWGIVNMKSPWWPLNSLTSSVHDFEAEFDNLVDGQLSTIGTELQTVVGGLANAGDAQAAAAANLAAVEAKRADLVHRAAAVRALGPGNERLKLMTDIVLEADEHAATPLLNIGNEALNNAGVAIKNASSVASTALQIVGVFKDNPGRRILSLSLGATAGIVVAGFTGLNLFVAASASTAVSLAAAAGSGLAGAAAPAVSVGLDGQTGALLTGLIIGLGSGPTHEVIKLIQQTKQSKKESMNESIKDRSGSPAMLAGSLNKQAAVLLANGTTRPVKA